MAASQGKGRAFPSTAKPRAVARRSSPGQYRTAATRHTSCHCIKAKFGFSMAPGTAGCQASCYADQAEGKLDYGCRAYGQDQQSGWTLFGAAGDSFVVSMLISKQRKCSPAMQVVDSTHDIFTKMAHSTACYTYILCYTNCVDRIYAIPTYAEALSQLLKNKQPMTDVQQPYLACWDGAQVQAGTNSEEHERCISNSQHICYPLCLYDKRT